MTVRSGDKEGKHDPPGDGDRNHDHGPAGDHRLSGWHVAALGIVATVIIAALQITKSPDAVKVVSIPILIALGVLVGRYYLGGRTR
jgi:hypothetical protein